MDERSRWQNRAKPWREWAPRLAEAADRFNRPLLEYAEVTAGLTVLDLASGAGEPALALAAGVDPVGASLLSTLRRRCWPLSRRAAEADVTAHLVSAEMGALPFARAVFDCVTCRFGLMFAPDPVTALCEAHRVLKPGGRAAIMVWGPIVDNSLFSVIEEAATAAGLRTEGAGSLRFAMAEPGRLGALFSAAGFGAVAEHDLRLERRPRVDADPPFWRPQVGMACGDRFASATAEQLERFGSALRNGFALCAEDGRMPLGFCARIGVSTAS
jgi:SAM-dependent methyltransferase